METRGLGRGELVAAETANLPPDLACPPMGETTGCCAGVAEQAFAPVAKGPCHQASQGYGQ